MKVHPSATSRSIALDTFSGSPLTVLFTARVAMKRTRSAQSELHAGSDPDWGLN